MTRPHASLPPVAAPDETSSESRPFLSLQDVTLRLYGRTLFEGTHWVVRADEQWAVVGANGAGKSTLVRALCGHVPVVGGRIVYHDLRPGAAVDEQIAYVSFGGQQAAWRPQGGYHQARWNAGVQAQLRSVSDYLSAGSVRSLNPFQIVEAPADSARFDALRERAVARLGIAPLLARDLIQLSDGERRKVSIARALLRDPALLILDNPFTGLDTEARAVLRSLIEQLMRERTRVMTVVARPREIPRGTTHVLLVDEQRVIAGGPRHTVLAHLPGDASAPAELALPARNLARPSGGTVLIRMRAVRVRYNGAAVLDGVDWTVRQGQHWALLGPNGAGKTTLLSLIQGDHPQAYANDITLFGVRRGSGETIWEIKRHIGSYSPELHLYHPPGTPCLDVVCSGLRDSIGLHERSTAAQRRSALAWLARVGAGALAEAPFSRISEGEQRLVLLARALVKQPRLLILDEPCQGLDAQNQARILRVVEAAGRELQTSIIYVTHDVEALPSITTHILRLERGRVVYRGERPPLPPESQIQG